MSLRYWIIHGYVSSEFWRIIVSLSTLDGYGFHSFSIEMGETWLALTDSSDREMKDRIIHISTPSRRDDCYIPGYSGASQTTHRWSTCYMDNMTEIRPRVLEITGHGAPSNDSEVRALKLTWFRKQFLMDPLTDVQTQQHARAYILYMIETTLFSNYSTNMTYLKWWPLLEDFDACGVMSWVVLCSHFCAESCTKFLWCGLHSSVT